MSGCVNQMADSGGIPQIPLALLTFTFFIICAKIVENRLLLIIAERGGL